MRDTYDWYTDVQALATLPIGYLLAIAYRMQHRDDTDPFRTEIDRAVLEQRSRMVAFALIADVREGGPLCRLIRPEALQEITDPGLTPLLEALSLEGLIAAYFDDPAADLEPLFEEARLRQMINAVPASVPRLAEGLCEPSLSGARRAITPEARHGVLLAQACIRTLLTADDRRPRLLLRQKQTDPVALLDAQGLANSVLSSEAPLTLPQRVALRRHLRLGQETLIRAGLTELACQLAIYRMMFLD